MMKKILITTAIIMFAVFCIYLGNQRSIEATVIDNTNNITVFQDIKGNLWEYISNDYKIDDKVIITFNDKGSDFLTDDEIINIKKISD